MRSRFIPIPRSIEEELFDVVVVGAGFNGTGIARDASLRGLKVLVLDKGDLAQGTSSRSARMIHGGLRYLKHGDLGLVWESLKERKNLIHVAPHLVKPIKLFIPFYEQYKNKPWKIRLGLSALDFFSLLSGSSLGGHENLSRQEILNKFTAINPDGLLGGAFMPDAYAEHGERLCVENILSACRGGARFINHAEVTELLVERNRVCGLVFHDHLENTKYTVRAKLVVNVAGPWVDNVLSGVSVGERLIGGSKGSFLVVDSFPGAPEDLCFFETFEDGRPIVVAPWNGRYLIGTTDIRYNADPDQAAITPEEVDYLLQGANQLFPKAKLNEASIRFTYAGVRPLPFQGEGSAVDTTRKHIVHDHAPEVQGLISIVGGKLSTFRSLAEETVDKIVRNLAVAAAPCTTDKDVLPGAVTENFEGFCEQFKKGSGLPEKSSQRLLDIYGTRSDEVLKIADGGGKELREPFEPSTGAIGAEVLMAFQQEYAQTLSDVLLRRSMVAYDSAFDEAGARKAAEIAAKYLCWDGQRIAEELKNYDNDIQYFQTRTTNTCEKQQEGSE